VRELERELGAERDTLIASSYAEEVVPEALDGHTGEERTRVYRMLQLEVRPEGYEVSEALCNRRQKGRSRSQSTKPIGLSFRALLTEDDAQVLFIARGPVGSRRTWRRDSVSLRTHRCDNCSRLRSLSSRLPSTWTRY
jgi:hypothetical protein